MNHDEDLDHGLERLISGSLASRSDRVGPAAHSLDDVHRRVELRRGRRRHVAAFGATTMLAAGAFALASIGSSDPSTVPLAAPPTDLTTATTVPAAWRCTGQLPIADAQGASYFEHCEPTDAAGITPTTVMMLPTTTMVCPADALDTDTAVTTMPCPGWSGTIPLPMQTTTVVPDQRAPFEQAYEIRPGDSLASIAALHGITLEQLVGYNEFADGADHLLLPGEYVLIPPDALMTPVGPPVLPLATTTTSTTTTTTP